MASLATDQAERAISAECSRSSISQVKPSPIVCHSAPSSLSTRASPDFHLPDLRNWTTHTFQPRPRARSTVPMAAVVLPLPSPVATRTSDGALRVAWGGAVVGGWGGGSVGYGWLTSLRGPCLRGHSLERRERPSAVRVSPSARKPAGQHLDLSAEERG